MKHVCIALAVTALAASAPARGDDSHVRLNTVGFLPDAPKRASVAAPFDRFGVVRVADEVEVFSGQATAPAVNEDTGESLRVADFSQVKAPGLYCVDIPSVGRSAPFYIAHDVYAEPFAVAMRGMYLWRCGAAVSTTHDGRTFAHG